MSPETSILFSSQHQFSKAKFSQTAEEVAILPTVSGSKQMLPEQNSLANKKDSYTSKPDYQGTSRLEPLSWNLFLYQRF